MRQTVIGIIIGWLFASVMSASAGVYEGNLLLEINRKLDRVIALMTMAEAR